MRKSIAFIILASFAMALVGCSTIKKKLLEAEGIAKEFELAEGKIWSTGHTISGHINVTGGFDEEGEYQLESLDGLYTNAASGRSIGIDGKRAKKPDG